MQLILDIVLKPGRASKATSTGTIKNRAEALEKKKKADNLVLSL